MTETIVAKQFFSYGNIAFAYSTVIYLLKLSLRRNGAGWVQKEFNTVDVKVSNVLNQIMTAAIGIKNASKILRSYL